MISLNPIYACDFYKVGHKFQYPEGTEEIYSNFTPRSGRLFHGDQSQVVNFGIQGFIKQWLIEMFNEQFFAKNVDEVVSEYKAFVDMALGCDFDPSHIRALHNLGYLPLEIKSLPEGSVVPVKVPVLTVRNTLPEFFWLPNYIETLLSAELWKPITSATIAFNYRKILQKYAIETGSPLDFILWQGHDFSFRGLSGSIDAATSGAGHLPSFLGTDTIPAILYVNKYYNGTKTFVGGSVPATEHSVMCAGGKENEIDTFRRILKTYPTGVVSIVSDTWDFWNVVGDDTSLAAQLKEEILNRQPNAIGLAKTVFRPDSGDPVDILCGTISIGGTTPEEKGAVECLWDIFGGTVTPEGYKVLDQHVGLIYGDSITLERAEQILQRLKDKGFASCNVVFGIGSFTYQYNTRDTFGMAMKATHAVVNGENRELFKDPATDSGTKKSAKGYLRVEKEDGKYVLYDQQTREQEKSGELKTVFLDGEILNETSIDEIRSRIDEQLKG